MSEGYEENPLTCSYPLRFARPPILGGQHYPEEIPKGMQQVLNLVRSVCISGVAKVSISIKIHSYLLVKNAVDNPMNKLRKTL